MDFGEAAVVLVQQAVAWLEQHGMNHAGVWREQVVGCTRGMMGVCDEEGAFAGQQHEGAGITRGVRGRFMGRV